MIYYLVSFKEGLFVCEELRSNLSGRTTAPCYEFVPGQISR